MRKKTFYLIDDDVGVRKVLAKIIENEELGRVVGESGDGETAEIDIMKTTPDIILIDLLLPNQDGIRTVQNLKKKGYLGHFIMFSQVSEQAMVAEAYESGIEFLMQKPLNRAEVVAVIKSLCEKIHLQLAVATIRSTLNQLGLGNFDHMALPIEPKRLDLERARKVLLRILSDLGILGEAGCRDINSIILFLLGKYEPGESLIQLHHLQSVYRAVREHYEKTQEKGPSVDEKAIEQRVRRAVGAALHNVASLGVEDYGHQLFNTYANKLFDFSEVRNEMRYLRNESPYHGKINVKKFLEALLIEVQQQARE